MLALLEGPSINWLQATPACWRMLLSRAGWRGRNTSPPQCGGEVLDPGLAEQLCARTRRLWNCYGPTEATVWSLVSEGALATGWRADHHQPQPARLSSPGAGRGGQLAGGGVRRALHREPGPVRGYWRKPA